MSTGHFILTIIEWVAAAGLITSFIYENRIIQLEERITAKIKRRIK